MSRAGLTAALPARLLLARLLWIGLLLAGLPDDGPAGAAARGPSGVTVLDGRCAYADRYAELAGRGYAFALCARVRIAVARDGSASIDFVAGSGASNALYSGTMTADAMAVRSLRIRSGETRRVTGTCDLHRRDGAMSVITCIATDRGTTFAANFERAADP